ncbi:V-type ATPase subunit [Proteiniclasticum sp. BAD-10]|uniref:V-type ATPase subunit n=1 Tax=Proteiniclasticum sediminis TaxID=2804028 RepID=A0A941CPN2_9CLOT|nr:V-type ATPase subunit [Proteiniclasticum sediminis]MBR0575344.1 V-type ATPase subunit [Proteiniclasticum sediminis]
MKNMDSPAIASKAKAMYGNRLKQEDYEELIRKRSVPEIAAYLKNETDYGASLKDIYENTIHRGQLEQLIRRHMFQRLLKLLKFSQLTKNEFYKMNLIQREIDIILMSVRALTPDKFEDDDRFDDMVMSLPVFLNDYLSFNMAALPSAKTFGDILKVLERTPYHGILQAYPPDKEGKLDYTSMERELQSYYYEYVFEVINRTFKGKRKKELLEIYRTQIELSNITKIYRFKKFFKVTNAEIRKAMLGNKTRMSRAQIDELIELPTAEDVLKALESSKYHLYIDDDDYVFIEYYANKIKYNLAKRYMHFSIDAPLIFTAYSILFETEVQNLVNIIEGIRYETPIEEIEKLLIY